MKVIHEEIQFQDSKQCESKEQYHVNILDRFCSFENFDENVDINMVWKRIRENIKF
jgi:hypothetical protein